jgi:type I restriction-modification system DNA methylase subunit
MAKTGKPDWDLIQLRAIKFANRWQKSGKTNEKSYGHGFVLEFLDVFFIDWLTTGEMEHRGFDGYSDYFCPGQIIIEMKSKGADPDFRQATRQLKRYTQDLPEKDKPSLWMACDFENIRLWNHQTQQVYDFKTNKLKKYKKHFAPLVGQSTDASLRRDKEGVNRQAAEKMAKLHDELKKHGYSGQDLEIYLARLLFCLFANDTDIFEQNSFQIYIEDSAESGSDLDARLLQLFQDLNESVEKRIGNPFLSDQIDTSHFKYINGGLFEKTIRRGKFDRRMRQELLDCLEFDWSQISPAIFGSMFQGVMDKDQRREIGAQYTSEENILKLINPLFMDGLYKEFNSAKRNGKALAAFQKKLAKLKFLDPACGCGNFLIIAYRELRRLELEVVKTMLGDKQDKMLVTPIAGNLFVNVDQFYGIEIEEWPCQIARTGMWLMDHLMNLEATAIFEEYEYRLPLKQSATIVHGNALRMDWEDVVPKNELSYILGNPPFVGKKEQSKEQKAELLSTFGNNKGIGNLDYVTAWYRKASEMMNGTAIQAAFVSTNSISQGEQAPVMWKALRDAVKIDFAYKTFKWSNEAKGKAAVHCVIVGFSHHAVHSGRVIFDGDEKTTAVNISPYLVDGPDVLIESRSKPLCDVPEMAYGSMPIDNGALIFSKEEMDNLQIAEPQSEKFVRQYLGGDELLNNTIRYCLWLKGFALSEYKTSKFITERIKRCKQFREKSNRPQTIALADTPQLFGEIRQPETNMLVIPKVSSENRKYLPIGFLPPEVIVNGSALIIPDATLYHFGVLSSNVHMAWTRAVCGRLEMRYQYSKAIVYNNFPWPDATDKQKVEIEELAQRVLKARAKSPNETLANLYNPLGMPPELVKAHNALDKAVMKLYGFANDAPEPAIATVLIDKYQEFLEIILRSK